MHNYILVSDHTNAKLCWSGPYFTSTLMTKPIIDPALYANLVNLFQNCSYFQASNVTSFDQAHNTMSCIPLMYGVYGITFSLEIIWTSNLRAKNRWDVFLRSYPCWNPAVTSDASSYHTVCETTQVLRQ